MTQESPSRTARVLHVATSEPPLAVEDPRHHLGLEFRRAELLHRPGDHRGGAEGHPRHMRPALLQLPDAVANTAESAFAFRLPLAGEVSGFAERQVHALIEVIAGFAVTAKN